jgi:2'-5' RNA ligase
MTSTEPAPLILTLALEPAAFAFFDGQRRRHFPPERNLIPAHVTLFHALPSVARPSVRAELERACAERGPISVEVTGLRFLGRGVAYELQSAGLAALRAGLAAAFAPWLTPQDRQGFRPHVTVQNKVAPETARALLRELDTSFRPFTCEGVGLDLWHYRGGPWEPAAALRFAGAEVPA